MNWVDGLGFLASTAVLATFCMRRMIMLRVAALASNVLFAAYGYIDHLPPVLLLHIALFPVNTFRLVELLAPQATGSLSEGMVAITNCAKVAVYLRCRLLPPIGFGYAAVPEIRKLGPETKPSVPR